MSGGSYIKVDVGCPFYRYDDARKMTVACEGVTDGSIIMQRYTRKMDWECQIRTFCCQHWARCEIYRMLMENKYEEEDI